MASFSATHPTARSAISADFHVSLSLRQLRAELIQHEVRLDKRLQLPRQTISPL